MRSGPVKLPVPYPVHLRRTGSNPTLTIRIYGLADNSESGWLERERERERGGINREVRGCSELISPL